MFFLFFLMAGGGGAALGPRAWINKQLGPSTFDPFQQNLLAFCANVPSFVLSIVLFLVQNFVF